MILLLNIQQLLNDFLNTFNAIKDKYNKKKYETSTTTTS